VQNFHVNIRAVTRIFPGTMPPASVKSVF